MGMGSGAVTKNQTKQMRFPSAVGWIHGYDTQRADGIFTGGKKSEREVDPQCNPRCSRFSHTLKQCIPP